MEDTRGVESGQRQEVESRSSAKIQQLPVDVGIATELNLAGVGQCNALGGSGYGVCSLNVSYRMKKPGEISGSAFLACLG